MYSPPVALMVTVYALFTLVAGLAFGAWAMAVPVVGLVDYALCRKYGNFAALLAARRQQ